MGQKKVGLIKNQAVKNVRNFLLSRLSVIAVGTVFGKIPET